jgi:PiT family inorganic phosphate transporter
VIAANPVLDKAGQPMSAWSAAVKWKEVKLKQEKALAPAPPEVMAALGDGIKQNGTHNVKVGTNRLQVVVFSGRAKLVIEKTKEDKGGLLYKVVIPMVSSPVMGFLCGFLFMGILYFGLQSWRPVTVNRVFGKLQLVSCAYMGFGHGMNDATKCMGIITLALVAASTQGGFEQVPDWLAFLKTSAGSDPFHLTPAETVISWLPNWLQFGYMPPPIDVKSQAVPSWVVVTCALTMAAGTAAGGWRIIATLGHRLVKLQPVHGFAAETTAATVLAVTGSLGMPVSTTHAITTSIMGVGCAKRFSALKLKVVERIVWAWVLTIPITAALAYGMVRALQFAGFIK